jgi:hypothetical protein
VPLLLLFAVGCDILKDQNDITFIVNTPVGHLGPQDEGIMILWNISNSNKMTQRHNSEDLVESEAAVI